MVLDGELRARAIGLERVGPGPLQRARRPDRCGPVRDELGEDVEPLDRETGDLCSPAVLGAKPFLGEPDVLELNSLSFQVSPVARIPEEVSARGQRAAPTDPGIAEGSPECRQMRAQGLSTLSRNREDDQPDGRQCFMSWRAEAVRVTRWQRRPVVGIRWSQHPGLVEER